MPAACQIELLLGTDMPDRRAMVAGDVVFGAEDDGNRAVMRTVIGDEHCFRFMAIGALAAADQVDRAAERLDAFAGQHAVGIQFGHRALAVMADDVVEIELVFSVAQITGVHVDVGGGAPQVAGKPRVGFPDGSSGFFCRRGSSPSCFPSSLRKREEPSPSFFSRFPFCPDFFSSF